MRRSSAAGPRPGRTAVLALAGVLGLLALSSPALGFSALTLEEQAVIDADLARDRNWTEIVTAAVAEGMLVGDVVEYLVENVQLRPGGAYDVVNSLISTGFDAETVIRGALRGGGGIQPVFNAASDAGTDREVIFSGGRAAGFSDYQVSDAFAAVLVHRSGNEAGSGGTGSGVSSRGASSRGDRR